MDVLRLLRVIGAGPRGFHPRAGEKFIRSGVGHDPSKINFKGNNMDADATYHGRNVL
jgi:hypothetical protein